MEIRAQLKISPATESFLRNNRNLAPKAIEKGMYYIAVEGKKNVEKRITELGLSKTGKLKRGITGEVFMKEKAIIGAKAFYAPILESGAKPHTIKFADKKALNWQGASHPVREVKHPGIRKKKFLSGPIEDMSDSGELESIFSRGVREAMERYGLNG